VPKHKIMLHRALPVRVRTLRVDSVQCPQIAGKDSEQPYGLWRRKFVIDGGAFRYTVPETRHGSRGQLLEHRELVIYVQRSHVEAL
jgi:hypothetical protein